MLLEYRHFTRRAVEALEIFLTLAVIAGIIIYLWSSVPILLTLDWGKFETLDQFIQSILAVFIGIEIIQLVKVHSLRDVFMIAILIFMRKSLDAENTTYEMIALIMAAIVVVSVLGILSRKKPI